MSDITVFQARKVITMNPRQPDATHVAVRDGRILAVGSVERMREWEGFELDQRFAARILMPGFVEGHCHLKEGSVWQKPYVGWFDRRDPDGKVWSGLRSMAEVVERLKALVGEMSAKSLPETHPLMVWGFDPLYFGGERMSAKDLDQASANRPIVVTHISGHLLNVNSPTLQLAGIDSRTEVEGVVKFANGEPTGELQEFAAMFLVQRKLGKDGQTASIDEPGVRAFASIANMYGVTTATDLLNKLTDEECALLESLAAEDGFQVRIVPAFRAFHAPAWPDDRRGSVPAHGGARLCANLLANHVWYWGDQHYETTMVPDRAHRLDACRTALDCSVPLAIHSDAPVTPLGPLFIAWCAVNRVTPKGRTLGENERISVDEALHAITLGAAWTLKLDREVGSIECGKRADFAVLEDDPLAVDPMRLKDVRVSGTVLSGRALQAA